VHAPCYFRICVCVCARHRHAYMYTRSVTLMHRLHSTTACIWIWLLFLSSQHTAAASSVQASGNCIIITTTDDEFLAVFSEHFRMSDGSTISSNDSPPDDAAKYEEIRTRKFARNFMQNINGTVKEGISPTDKSIYSITFCEKVSRRQSTPCLAGTALSTTLPFRDGFFPLRLTRT
jgi:hypothetical protein